MAEHRADKKDGWQRYDWMRIEFDYVCNPEWQGLRKIAKKYGCNIKTVARHSKKDNWYQKRKEFLAAVVRESMIKSYMKRAESKVLELLNEERITHGLEPVDDLPSEYRRMLREEIERMC